MTLRERVTRRVFFWLYFVIAVTWCAEGVVRSPFVATASGLVTARLLGGVEIPVEFGWADTARVFVVNEVPNGAVAVALGRVVILSERVRDDESVLLHEVIHVRQYERFLSFGFSLVYSYHALRLLLWNGGNMGYAHYAHPFEVAAYRAQFGVWSDEHVMIATRNQ